MSTSEYNDAYNCALEKTADQVYRSVMEELFGIRPNTKYLALNIWLFGLDSYTPGGNNTLTEQQARALVTRINNSK